MRFFARFLLPLHGKAFWDSFLDSFNDIHFNDIRFNDIHFNDINDAPRQRQQFSIKDTIATIAKRVVAEP